MLRWLGDPNTGPIKFVPLAIGAGAGLAASYGLRAALVEPDRAKELETEGVPTVSSREASVYAMALPFSFAAGVGLGLKSRGPTSGFTTASQLVTAALLSTVAGAVINADSDKAENYITGIGAMAAATGAGMLLGVRDEVKMAPLRMIGLGLFGVSIGVATPMLIDAARSIPAKFGASIEHRER